MKCFMCNEGKIKTIKFHTYTEQECDNCGATIDKSHIELNERNERLRKALEMIAGTNSSYIGQSGWEFHEIADEALEESK